MTERAWERFTRNPFSHAQVDLPSAIIQFEEVKARHAEAVQADPKRYGPRLVEEETEK